MNTTKRIFGTRHYKSFSEAIRTLGVSANTKLDVAAIACAVFQDDNPKFQSKKFARDAGLLNKPEST